MACHEIAALRLGLMTVLGLDDQAERQHELAELGGAEEKPGPLRSLSQAKDLASVQRLYEASLVGLEAKVAEGEEPEDGPGGDAEDEQLDVVLHGGGVLEFRVRA